MLLRETEVWGLEGMKWKPEIFIVGLSWNQRVLLSLVRNMFVPLLPNLKLCSRASLRENRLYLMVGAKFTFLNVN